VFLLKKNLAVNIGEGSAFLTSEAKLFLKEKNIRTVIFSPPVIG
jgi:hypothetical protein